MIQRRNILIAHYKEDLSWLDEFEFDGNIIVYSKTDHRDPKRHISINKSQEVPMYIKYILDNYDDLPDKILFMHGHSDSPHQDYPSRYICENVDWNHEMFFSVNKRDWYQEVSSNIQVSSGSFDIWLRKYWDIFSEFLSFPENGLRFYSGAQFVVDKSLIIQYPRLFWQRLYDWSISEEINLPGYSSDYVSSRIFEYTWHYIFTKDPIEPQKEYSQIFKK